MIAASGIVAANGIEIAYETSGDRTGRPLLLVAGGGHPMISWRPELVSLLADRGFHVIRFDNRDVGRSTHLHGAGVPDLMAAVAGDTSSSAYSLDDMAEDGFGLLDALDVPAAHVLGVSTGGMIAQTMAALYPDRVRSLVSVMSAPSLLVCDPSPEAQAVFARVSAPSATREAAVKQMIGFWRVVGSPGYPRDEAWTAELAGRMWDVDPTPDGGMRQTMAIYASGDRSEAVRGIRVPTLVVHGDSDPLISLDAGRATAALIPDAELLVIPGMGHDLPQPIWPQLVDAVWGLARRADPDPVPATR
jgi:pimeloyl-ACP methyl ester carboxylesterase